MVVLSGTSSELFSKISLTGAGLSLIHISQQLIDLDCNFDQCKFPKEEEEILPPAELLKQYFEKRAALDHEIDKTLSEIQNILDVYKRQQHRHSKHVH